MVSKVNFAQHSKHLNDQLLNSRVQRENLERDLESLSVVINKIEGALEMLKAIEQEQKEIDARTTDEHLRENDEDKSNEGKKNAPDSFDIHPS